MLFFNNLDFGFRFTLRYRTKNPVSGPILQGNESKLQLLLQFQKSKLVSVWCLLIEIGIDKSYSPKQVPT
jgi:hypothetical protein